MKRANLYLRVSTDEQALNGFSLGYQEDVLRQYCQINNIQVLQIISEEFSAKNFQRPEWSSLLLRLKNKKIDRPNYILFTKWDRFSRNAADAYSMIIVLKQLGVEPQAVEQPLNLSVPENKLLLAFYLVAPEVENDRRSINVKTAMHKAKLEGRWMGTAPIGYVNKTSASGQKYIVPHEPAASLLKEAFGHISQKQFNIHQAYKIAIAKGLVCSLTNFCHALRSPVYCGKIIVANHHNQHPTIVEGRHDKIISEVMFNEVQNVINRRKNKKHSFVNGHSANEMLPFRGFLYCPNCKQKLTGSGSLGKTKRYFYYHCKCGFRTRADKVHQSFLETINALKPLPEYRYLFTVILEKLYKESSFLQSINQRHSIKRIEELHDNICNARCLLLSKDIDAGEYHKITSDYETKITILKNKLEASLISLAQFKNRIEFMCPKTSELQCTFEKADISEKRQMFLLLFQKNIEWSDSCFHKYLNPPRYIT